MHGDIAVMVCIADGGYHSQVTYEWKRTRVVTSRSPVSYEELAGTYTCVITGLTVSAKRSFRVEGRMLVIYAL